MEEQTTSTPHDAIFKHFMAHVDTARDFLDIYLPPALRDLCDLSTLKLEATSMVEKNLRSRISDILYSVKTRRGTGYIYTLIEHQSSPEKHMAFRMLRYSLDVMQRHLDANNKTLPIVIPLLFYHGEVTPYPYSLRWLDGFSDPELAKRLYCRPFPLVDITVVPDSEIMQHRRIATLELLQKHIRLRDLSGQIAPLAALLTMGYTSKDRLIAILNYMLHTGTAENPEKLLHELSQRTSHHEGTLMTIAEYLEQKGWARGTEEGQQKGRGEEARRIALAMLKNGLDPTLITEITGVAETELAEAAIH
ncbi:Rpn family recombination-promoting nuclease/putative transposase [Pseudocitrobacter cyperus]|uniref:Rpn family recombination-promoting nuclease/putative transposase n=1 Tax=Pseudocitrobacter cyperus TaxID=3112843 RepID=A0ABV0HMZ4_9ENTR